MTFPALAVRSSFLLAPLALVAGLDSSTRIRPEQPGHDRWAYQTEQHWLVTQAVDAVRRLAARAASVPARAATIRPQPAGAGAPSRFDVQLDRDSTPLTIELTADRSVWTPETYQALAAHVMGRVVKTEAAAPPPELLEALTTPRSEVIEDLNQQLSAGLAQHPAAPALHEAAALLIGALALREAAGHFTDPRLLLVAMASHLAVADALREATPPSVHGHLARAVLETLVGRQTASMGILRELSAGADVPRAVRAWVRAVEIRTTLDWRRLAHSQEASLLERLQHVRALQCRLKLIDAGEFVKGHEAEPIPDWGRILLSADFTVDDGNRYAAPGLADELAEMARVYERRFGRPLSPPALVPALTHAPAIAGEDARMSPAAVIDWRLWSAHFERQVVHRILTASIHLRSRPGLKEDAVEWERQADTSFGALRLYPLVRRLRMSGNATDAVNTSELAPIWNHPELITAYAWGVTRQRSAPSFGPTPIGPEPEWFSPTVPVGTVPEDVYWRTHGQLSESDSARIAHLRHRRAMAPWRRALAVEDVQLRYANRVTPAIVEQEYGPFLAYDVHALHALAEAAAGEPAVRQRAYEALCRLSFDQCGRLAWHLIDEGRPQEAVPVYRKWIRDSRDRAVASNEVEWLVRYELSKGDTREALRLAADAASTGSHAGSLIHATVLDELGRHDEAEAALQRMAARYGSKNALLAFYLRNRSLPERPHYTVRSEGLLQELFPDGMARGLTQDDFTSKPGAVPDGGVMVLEPTRRLEDAGVLQGDVVVALNGTRVRNLDQYDTIRLLSLNERLTLVYWRKGEYRQAEATFPNQAIANTLQNYTAP